MKLSKKHKRGIRRKVDLEGGIVPPKSAVFKNKKNITVKINIKMDLKNLIKDCWPTLVIVGLTLCVMVLIINAQ